MATKRNSKNKERVCCEPRHGAWGGVFLIILGLIFLLNNYGLADIDIGRLWPLVLIVPGIFILLHKNS